MGKNDGLKIAKEINANLATRIQDKILYNKSREEEKKRLNTVENKRALRRNKINQFLTECNEKNPENRIKNTEAFIDLVCMIICKEWSEVVKDAQFKSKLTSKPISQKDVDINKFVNGYSSHIHNLVKFDADMVYCENPLCKTSMAQKFLKEINLQLPILYTKFANLIMEKEVLLNNRETIKEA